MVIPGLDVRVTARYELAILRIVLGIAMLLHGWSKLSGGVGGVAGFFGSLGIPAPALMAWVVTIVELVGGILLIAGFLSQIAGILVALNMLGAILFNFLLKGTPLSRTAQSPGRKKRSLPPRRSASPWPGPAPGRSMRSSSITERGRDPDLHRSSISITTHPAAPTPNAAWARSRFCS